MLDLASKPMNLGQLLIKDFTVTAWGASAHYANQPTPRDKKIMSCEQVNK